MSFVIKILKPFNATHYFIKDNNLEAECPMSSELKDAVVFTSQLDAAKKAVQLRRVFPKIVFSVTEVNN